MVERKAGWSDFISILLRVMTVFVVVMLLSACDGGQPTEDIDPVPPVVILPSNTFVLPSATQNLNVGGGTPPYQYTIMSGAGSIDASTGLFTASAVPGSTVIRVQDPNNLYATTTVTVVGPIVLSPATGTVGTGGALSLTASSGRPPYAYSIKSGGGSVSSTGVFTAPSLVGASVVQVTDAFGQTATANLTTTTALSISPLLKTVLPGTTQTFTSAGGTSPHVFSLVSGGGTINPTTGIFLAPTTPGISVVRVTDANGLRAEGSITVASPISISPASATLAVNNSKVFAAIGGVAPYTFSILSGGGTINANSGAYTAPLTTGTVQLRVTDSLGQYATSSITINPPLSISPDPVTVVRSGSQLFNAGGGVPPYVYSVGTGGGSINGSTGAYVAPGLAGSATVKVTDSFGNTASASITILPPVTIAPTSLNLVASKTTTFAASGGEAPYTFSILSGGGSINSATGYFTAPANASSVIVRVTDNRGQTANAAVTVIATLGITPPSAAILVSTTKAFSWIGGLGPYTFSVASGSGSINATNGVFTAPASAGSVTVRVVDSMSQTADALVVVAAPLAISPTTAMLAVNTNKTFLPVGGLPPHTFSVVAGGGLINSMTGVYTAPSISGNVSVRVMDALGQAATANVIIAPALALLPETVTLAPTEGVTFAAWGGVPPYSYAVLSGMGSIGSVTGAYMAPASAGLDLIQVTDAQGNTATAAVTITAPISISPAYLELAINNESTLSASGGKPPYAFAVTNGSGSINASSGLYVAPGLAGSETITVTDSLGQSASAAVTVNEGLTLSPLNPKVIQNSLTNFSASGGVAPYTFSVEAGGGVVDVNTGVYTSPSVATNVTVRVTDSLGNFSETSITVAELIAITPTSLTMAVNNQTSFASAGGLAPISFSVASGDGVIDSVTGAFTAGSSSGTVVVQVEDSIGQRATATVTVNPALSLTPVTLNMIQNGGANFTANNGVPPYSFTVLSGGGVIDSATGEFISPNSSGEVTIRVTDSWENVADSTVTVYPAVNIAPTTLDVVVSQDSTFAATGGLAPYVYSIQSGGGAINAATGVFTAPGSIGSVTLKVTDSLGQIAQATVNVVDNLSLSPASIVMAVNTQNTFSAIGGLAPYAFTVISGGGSIEANVGTYTAPAIDGTATVQVTDGVGQLATATVTITPQLSLSPSASTLAPTEGMLFSAAGGVTPYSYAVISGGGLVSATTGLFAAPANSDFVIVQVTDAQGSTATSTVTVTNAISINPTSMALAILNTGDFLAAGGKPPYSYSVVSGLGSIDSVSGRFSSGGVAGSTVVRATDSLGQNADATVTINPALTISPANLDMVQNADAEFSAAGGVGPYTFSVVSGGGTVGSLTGIYRSPSTASTVTVRVADSLGNISDASVNVVDPVLIAPSAVMLAVGNSVSFTASGGLPPFAYTVVAGGGSIGSASGVYNAPLTSGTATVKVSDALGQIAEATVTINPALSITPSAIILPASGSQSFTSAGGVPPLTYSVVVGTGSIDPTTGVYVGPSSADAVTVRVTDSLSNTADAQVTILNNVLISPAELNIVRNGSITFTATEGQTPYTFAVLSGGGSIDSASGEFTAPGDAGSVVIRVTDNLGQVANANVNVVSAIQITPSALAMVVGTVNNFSASGGLAPYSYSVVSGGGSVVASTGVFSAPANAGTVTVRATDALGQSADASVNVVPVLTVSPSVLTMAVNTTETVTGLGGLVPYVYSVVSGGGSINAATGSYSSSPDPGMVTLRVTDSLGQFAETSVTVTPKLSLLPAAITLAPVESQLFAASGGVTPYSYSIVNGGGSIGLATGAFVGPASSGTVNVRVTDAQGSVADSVVTISAAISVSPGLLTLAVSNAETFTAAGGKPPYEYEVLSGGGSIGSSTGIYTAPASAGTAVIKVTDSLGQSAQANVNINSALGISPATLNIAQSGSATFSASGGVESYVFSVASGGGQIDAATGVYTAPSSAGSVTVRVTDSRGNTANATVTVLTPVVISPSSIALAVGNSETFTASGGITPYSFAILSGDGSVDATTGQYTAPAAAGSAKVRVTDGIGQVSSADITIHPALAIAASQSVLPAGGSATFSATGGVVPYEFSVVSGGGSVNSSTGVYSAPASASSVTVKVTDSRGNTSSIAITVKDPVAISPSSITLAVNNSTTFAASGGLAPFTYSILSGGGTIGSSTGIYVAPATAGSAVVRVVDALGQTAQASLTVNPALNLSPASIDVVQTGSVSFSAAGGVTPYTYSIVSGGGSINNSTGEYTAPNTAGSAVIRVTDSLGNLASSSVTVASPVQISPVSYTLAVNNQKTFTASGGLAPYTFSLVSGVGAITTAGVYTAPGTSGVATVKVTDSLGQVASANLTINAALSLSPSTLTMAQSSSATFAASGGVSPYSYSLISGGGSINSSSGAFTSPTSAGLVSIRVSDSLGNTADATVTVVTPITISPTTVTLAVNNSYTFVGAGGQSPFTYLIVSGGGSINSSSGVFTASVSAGSSVVRVTDAIGQTASATITINPALGIAPSILNLSSEGTQTFAGTNGVAPYSYSVVSGGGSINSSSGAYTAPAAGSAVTIRVTDLRGNTADASVSVKDPVVISPKTFTLAVNNSKTFSVSGGLGPFAYALVSGGGSIDSSTGVFTAPSASGTTVIKVTDSLGQSDQATITINPALSVSPNSITLVRTGTTTFTASGGVTAYTYSIVSGGGSINSLTGAFTAPAVAGTVTVRVTDQRGNTADGTVTVLTGVAISPASVTLAQSGTTTFGASGGQSPYTYSIVSGGGSISSSTGAFTGPTTPATVTVRVTDNYNQTADATVTVVSPTQISPTSLNMVMNGSSTLTGSGGSTPYTFSVVSGLGSIGASSGIFTSSGTSGAVVVRLTDAIGQTAEASIQVVSAVTITPATVEMAINTLKTFTASGGLAPYTYSITSGGGSINSATGAYTAPATSGSAVVRVTDSLGQTASASITINPALGITPSSITLAPTEGTTFTGTGGVTPYSYSVISGGGSIGASTGAFVAPTSASVVLVQVTDAQGSTATASATITNAISISPTSKTLAVNNTATFTAAGGKSAYTFSIVSGGGSINATSGVYTAGATSGSAVVKVTDSLNQSAQATITINPALSLSPTAITLAQNATTTFTAAGGVSPYTYSILSGSGTLNSSTGAFTAPAAAGSVSVRVTDSLGNTANSTVTVVSPVVISPTSITLAVNNTYTFTATGGQTSYTYSLVSGVGSMNSSTGVYTAPASTGSAVVRVTDAIGQTSQATITINPALTISPSSVTLAANAAQTFTGSGGATPYSYSVVSGGGSINSSSGVFTAPSSAATVTVRVTDARNNTANATVTVINTLVISPSTITLAINNTYTFTSTGGLAPLTYSLVSGGGSMNASTGAYTAPVTTGSAVVRVTDSIGQTSQANVTINPALSISPASITISPNGTTTFTGAGGATPYSFSIVTGGGTINSSTGAFTAPATTGNVTVRVTDARSNSADASVIVETPVTISPSAITLAVNNTYTFTASGGRTPYSYSLVSGTGAINSSSGIYTAPTSSGSAVVKVTDAVGQISTASITVNPALSISPTSSSLVVNGTRTFTASGGVSPYTYSIVSGGGTINSSTGAFTAPASAATVSIRVTDARSNTANATVTVVSSVTISPSNLAMAINNTYTFTAIGGQTPYAYSVVSGVGSVNSSSGLYSAGTTTGSAQVRVTDALGQTSTATVTVNPVLKISPTTLSIYANNQNTFNGLDGAAPYSFSLVSGTGTINSVSGVYTAPASAGSATVRVTDARGNTANATITILDTLAISPTSANVLVNSTLDFNSTGGQAPVMFSILSGSGTIDSGTGMYTAGASADSTVIVKVTDANNATASASVNVYTALTISPTSITLTPNDLYTFAASGGVGTKTFSVFSGGGSINSTTGAYTAPSVVGTATIRVTDAIGNTASSSVTMNPDVQISPTTLTISVYQTYQFSSTNGVAPITYSVSAGGGSINSSGLFTAPSTAGTSTVRVSDARGNISDATVTVIIPTKIYAGGTTSCALFNNGSIKCWGNGASGQMGTGTTGNWGDVAGEMGNALPTINLGTGRTVKDLSVGANHICAILDTNALKCWGLNTNGQLGIGTTTTMGDSANEMGDSLPQINLGTGLTALKVAVGVSHTCAILNTGALKCWGLNTYGQLGLGNTTQLTAPSATAINLGTGRTAKSVVLGQHHTCAILDNNTLKCWGGNLNGQLGLGITTTNHKGDGASEMGDLLAAVNLGTGRTALQVTAGYAYTCALLDNSTVKCWGVNTSGQLGMGNTSQLSSPSATAVSLGTSLVPSKILSHNTSNCVLFTNGLIKCWGSGTSGGLGIGSTSNIGSGASQMGDFLAYTQIGSGLTMTDISRGWFGGCALTSTNRVKCWGNATSGFLGSGSTTLHLGDAAGEMGDTLPFVGF